MNQAKLSSPLFLFSFPCLVAQGEECESGAECKLLLKEGATRTPTPGLVK